MPHSAVLDERIGALSAKLEAVHPRITSIHVIVDELDRHKEQGRLFEVRLDVKAPRAEIVANHQRHQDPYVAMRDAFDAVIRQLTETVDRQRGDVKKRADDRADNTAS
jgi:ribosome-associated translation inhibitor RaiA